MSIKDWTKLIVAVVVVGATCFLAASKVIDGQAAVAVISAVLGYIFGNGHGVLEAKRNTSTSEYE